jgi:serine/threonine-protein kinase HipA
MCQLTGRLTEAKYRGSYEQIGKVILAHSANPGFDSIAFFELVVFCFLTGNNDMHLKNFSLFKHPRMGYVLSPAYDLVASELVVEGDEEELALNLNGKKKKLKRRDFHTAMRRFMNEKAMTNIFRRFKKVLPKWYHFINISFLPDDMKRCYCEMIAAKAQQIEL